jgi:septum formation protein
LGVPFTIAAADVDETPLPGESPCDMVIRLSRAKAQAVAASPDAPGDAAVLACDTMVALDERLLGKPADAAEAAEMLAALRGRTHQVYTAVCLAWDGELEARLSVSDVMFRDYGADEMAAYIATGDPLDKAGARSTSGVRRWLAGKVATRASWGCR